MFIGGDGVVVVIYYVCVVGIEIFGGGVVNNGVLGFGFFFWVELFGFGVLVVFYIVDYVVGGVDFYVNLIVGDWVVCVG